MTTPDPRMRAADTDRQATVDRLTDHFTAGRLTASEYDDRVRQAYASTYLDELPALLADLPDDRGRGWDGGGTAGRAGDGPDWGGDETGWDGDGFGWRDTPGRPGRDAWYGPGPRWRGAPGGYRHRRPFAVLPVVLGVLFLVALTHGFILIPVFWIGLAFLVFGRHRRGGCGPRFGPRVGPRSAP